jgi:glycerol-3-phosphate acyltransferase PlsY
VLVDPAALILGYMLGSIPFSPLIARWRAGIDLRSVGIGNSGARNVWHVVGPAWGLLAFALDAAKGAAAVLLARAIGASALGGMLAGPAAILGHAYPVWCRFRGGIGLSTTVGILLAWTPLPALVGLGIWLVAQLMLRNLDRSLYPGAAAAIVSPAGLGYPWPVGAYALALFLLLWALKLGARSRQLLLWALKLGARSRQRRVWQASGWSGVTASIWYGARHTASGERTESMDTGDKQP